MTLHNAAAAVAALFLAACVFAHTVGLRLSLLGTGILLCAAVAARGQARTLPPVWLVFALWGAWAALSITWSYDPAWSLKEWRNEVFYAGAALWICYTAGQAPHAGRIFPAVLAAAALLATALAMRDFSYGLRSYQSGWHGGPGDHSSMLLVLMPAVAAGAWYAHQARWPLRSAFALWSFAGLLLASGYTTLNRTLWLAFAAQFAVLGALVLLRSPRAVGSARTRLAVAVAGLAVVAGCSVVLLHVQAERQLVGSTALEQDPRLALWPEVLRYVEARPLSGYGFGRGVLREELESQFAYFDRNLWHAHNLFLEALVQTGVPGLLALLALLAALAREGWRAARDADDARAACGIALLGLLAGMLMRNMTDSLLVRQNALLFWGVAGVLLAWGRNVFRHPAP